MAVRRIELGDTWKCECGEKHKAEGAYLAAHWHIPLQHRCKECGRVHQLYSGKISLIMDPTQRKKQ